MSEEKKLRYEDAVTRLEEIVDILEGNRVPLDEAIGLFDEGLNLVQYCEKQLKTFDEKLDAVMKEHRLTNDDDEL